MNNVKTIVIKESIHAQIAQCAADRGMTIQGLAERIIRGWMDENFFERKIASGKKRAEVRP